MTEGLAFALGFAGFLALALAIHPHQRQVWRHTFGGAKQLFLRLCGVVSLAASFAVCIHGFGWSVGSVFWFGLATLAALAVALLLAFWPQARRLKPRRGPVR